MNAAALLSDAESKRDFARAQGVMPAPGYAEMVETVEFQPFTESDDSTNSTNSAHPGMHSPPYPRDSILEDWVIAMRETTEAPDSFILGGILPVCAALMGRRVFIRFGSKKYANLFSMIVGRAGMRKSTTLQPARELASLMLAPGALYSGTASEEALFKHYQTQPDRLFFEDEGNTVLKHWADSAPGQMVAKRMLKLYDCAPWEQAYLRQEADSKDGSGCVRIEETCTSLILGATYNCCRFNGLDNRDGMQRRVNYYFAECEARELDWPAARTDLKKLALAFSPLAESEGEFTDLRQLPGTFRVWQDIQAEVRDMKKENAGVSLDEEARLSTLSEIPAKTLKFAMIFELCRWAKSQRNNPLEIRPDTLKTAFAHAKMGMEAFRVIQTIGERAEIRSEADSLLATIRAEWGAHFPGMPIILSKSQITHRFAGNPSRKGARTPEHLYEKVIPDLIRRHQARDLGKSGNLHRFAFRPEIT